jgi:lauroyl/myristoyl acyltransferase
MSQWIFEKIAARTPTNFFALGMIAPRSNSRPETLLRIQAELPPNHVWLSGWELLGASIFGRVKANFAKVLVPMIVLVLLSLYLAFRRIQEICLSLCVLALSGLCLLSIMRLAGWSWNLLNLMAIPLVLGTGVDYSIFMQLALRRHGGNLNAAHLSVGRALLLCGGTALAGFGSLGLSSNAGMASLGQVCAVGIGSNMLIAIFLLPRWWQLVAKNGQPASPQASGTLAPAAPSTPSSLYRSDLWRLGLGLVKVLPTKMAVAAGRVLANAYWLLARHRRRVVIENLAPAVGGDLTLACQTGKQLHEQFARKVLHLWRYEAGLDISRLFGEGIGWEHFKAAQAQNRGVLLVTPHLGNWEFGGPMLTSRGVTLQVLTLAEPGRDFTRLRQASRARWHIETLVVGNNPLAFVEIIKRLEGGAAVALLIDRPPPASAITVQLFGRPFEASIAAAELARASGCALVPVYIPWQPGGYTAHMLPSVPYDRATLRDRSARQQLTQQIMSIFEPVIRQYLDQWYHFVPVWPNQNRIKIEATQPK